ncbi:mucin-5AC-like [Betta splendens]|uniref:Mucin-5AC-like n=1 Tax=Betta splendens TaxID=158456 RepID=A0A6P7P1S2_BETSP|nr:mucin-5AC-like [Betta splendens]XP_029024041.1 mucin-5AC-like [Betta splendens]
MGLLTMNLCLTLLWASSALLPVETVSSSAPVPQTGSTSSTAEPSHATAQLNTSRVPRDESQAQIATRGPTPQTNATAEAAAPHTTERQEAPVSSAGYGSNVSTAAGGRSHVFTPAAMATPSQTTAEPERTASTVATTTPALRSSAASAAMATPSRSETTAEPERTASTVATTTPALRSSAASSASAAAATLSHNETTAGEAEPERTASTRAMLRSSTAAAASTPEAASTTGPGATSNVSSTSSSHPPTHPPPSTQSFISPSASTGSTNTTNRTVEPLPAFNPAVTKPETASTAAGPPSPPQPVSGTHTPTSASRPPATTGSGSGSSSDAPSPSHSTASSSSTAGVFIRPVSRLLPVFSTKAAAATAAAPRTSQSPSGTAVQTCSSRGLVTQCLIIIASLAALATVFMVSTIVLCAKASARKSRVKRPAEETEMMCISALLPERNHAYTRQHNPVSNGVLVLPMGTDSDDDMGDNLTLSSFLPDNERTV